MLFSKNIFAVAAVLLGATLQAHAHAAIAPELGVAGTPQRSDVQRPTAAKPCGNTNIAQTFDTSGTVALQSDDTFTATITNFNTGVDGSRMITTVTVDPSGTGNKFVAASVVKNGVKAPTNVGSEQLVIQLPAGTKCTGGAAKNKCLVSLTTAGGFGNCVVVQQGGAASGATAGQNASATTKAKITTVKTGGKKAAAAASSAAACAETVTVTVTAAATATAAKN